MPARSPSTGSSDSVGGAGFPITMAAAATPSRWNSDSPSARGARQHEGLARFEELVESGGRDGGTEEVALHLVTLLGPQELELRLRLDSLGDGRELQTVRHRDDGGRDGGVIGIARDVAHEGLVDLDPVNREAFQVVERRVSRAEIVHRETQTEILQVPERRDRKLGVLHGIGFRDLEVERRWRKIRLLQGFGDLEDQVSLLELARGKVDGDRDGITALSPGAGLRAGGPEHPLADGDDQAGDLGDRDEVTGRHQTQFRMLPAKQRLGPADLAGRELDQGLVVNDELPVLERLAQPALER